MFSTFQFRWITLPSKLQAINMPPMPPLTDVALRTNLAPRTTSIALSGEGTVADVVTTVLTRSIATRTLIIARAPGRAHISHLILIRDVARARAPGAVLVRDIILPSLTRS